MSQSFIPPRPALELLKKIFTPKGENPDDYVRVKQYAIRNPDKADIYYALMAPKALDQIGLNAKSTLQIFHELLDAKPKSGIVKVKKDSAGNQQLLLLSKRCESDEILERIKLLHDPHDLNPDKHVLGFNHKLPMLGSTPYAAPNEPSDHEKIMDCLYESLQNTTPSHWQKGIDGHNTWFTTKTNFSSDPNINLEATLTHILKQYGKEAAMRSQTRHEFTNITEGSISIDLRDIDLLKINHQKPLFSVVNPTNGHQTKRLDLPVVTNPPSAER